MTEPSRYTIATGEEVWIRACYQFFEEYGFWDWYQVPQDKAFITIMKNTRGQGNPSLIRQKINELYKAAGVKQQIK
jgi:hypothetical protein